MNKTIEVISNSKYTFRLLEGKSDPFDLTNVFSLIDFLFLEWGLEEHLLITGGYNQAIQFSEDPQDIAYGAYMEGMQVVMLALDHENIEEVYITIAHELYHYLQDKEGTLGVSEECENEAEKKAIEAVKEWKEQK